MVDNQDNTQVDRPTLRWRLWATVSSITFTSAPSSMEAMMSWSLKCVRKEDVTLSQCVSTHLSNTCGSVFSCVIVFWKDGVRQDGISTEQLLSSALSESELMILKAVVLSGQSDEVWLESILDLSSCDKNWQWLHVILHVLLPLLPLSLLPSSELFPRHGVPFPHQYLHHLVVIIIVVLGVIMATSDHSGVVLGKQYWDDHGNTWHQLVELFTCSKLRCILHLHNVDQLWVHLPEPHDHSQVEEWQG